MKMYFPKCPLAGRRKQPPLRCLYFDTWQHHWHRQQGVVRRSAHLGRTAAWRHGSLFHVQRVANDAAMQRGGHVDRLQAADSIVPRSGENMWQCCGCKFKYVHIIAHIMFIFSGYNWCVTLLHFVAFVVLNPTICINGWHLASFIVHITR